MLTAYGLFRGITHQFLGEAISGEVLTTMVDSFAYHTIVNWYDRNYTYRVRAGGGENEEEVTAELNGNTLVGMDVAATHVVTTRATLPGAPSAVSDYERFLASGLTVGHWAVIRQAVADEKPRKTVHETQGALAVDKSSLHWGHHPKDLPLDERWFADDTCVTAVEAEDYNVPYKRRPVVVRGDTSYVREIDGFLAFQDGGEPVEATQHYENEHKRLVDIDPKDFRPSMVDGMTNPFADGHCYVLLFHVDFWRTLIMMGVAKMKVKDIKRMATLVPLSTEKIRYMYYRTDVAHIVRGDHVGEGFSDPLTPRQFLNSIKD